MLNITIKALKLTRIYGWWTVKISYLMIPLYVFLHQHEMNLWLSIFTFFMLLIYLGSTATFGHITNDMGDVTADHLSGKSNFSTLMPAINLYLVLLACITASMFSLFILNASLQVYILAVIELALFATYSLPPLRWKEKYIGIIIDSIYAHVIPFIIVILLFYDQPNYAPVVNANFLYFVIVWQLFSGIRGIMHHQIEDSHNDTLAGVMTAVTRIGTKNSEYISIYFIAPIELIVFLTIIVMLTELTLVPAAMLIIYTMILAIRVTIRGANRIKITGIYFWSRYLDAFYRKWLPLSILISLVWWNHIYWPLLLLHILFFGLPIRLIQIAWNKACRRIP